MLRSVKNAAEVASDGGQFGAVLAVRALAGGLFVVGGDFLGALLGLVGDDCLQVLDLVEQDVDLLVLLAQLLLLLQVRLPQLPHRRLQPLRLLLLRPQQLPTLLVLTLQRFNVLQVVRVGALQHGTASRTAAPVVIHQFKNK
jgi:hypothetical protein